MRQRRFLGRNHSGVPESLCTGMTTATDGRIWKNPGAVHSMPGLHRRYPGLWRGKFPVIRLNPWLNLPDHPPRPIPGLAVQRQTQLQFFKSAPTASTTVLLIIPWMELGGADKFNLDLVDQLVQQGWEITIAATAAGENAWLEEYKRLTSDIFILANFPAAGRLPTFFTLSD